MINCFGGCVNSLLEVVSHISRSIQCTNLLEVESGLQCVVSYNGNDA